MATSTLTQLLTSAWSVMMMSCCLMSSDVSWHIRDKLGPMPKHGSIILYVHGNQKARQDGQPRTSTSTLTQLLNYELLGVLMMMNWCLMSSDVMRHIRDKLGPMPKHGSIILYVHGNQKARQDGQPRTSTSTLTQLLNYELLGVCVGFLLCLSKRHHILLVSSILQSSICLMWT